MLVMKPILTEETLYHKIATSLLMPLLAMTIKIKESITVIVLCILIIFYTIFFILNFRSLSSFQCHLQLFNLTRSWQPDVPTIAPEIQLVVKFINFMSFMAMD